MQDRVNKNDDMINVLRIIPVHPPTRTQELQAEVRALQHHVCSATVPPVPQHGKPLGPSHDGPAHHTAATTSNALFGKSQSLPVTAGATPTKKARRSTDLLAAPGCDPPISPGNIPSDDLATL